MKVRTRFAPSPTGYMHIGNLRAALFAYLISKHEDGEFILRIEDTDRNRYVEGAIDFIYDIFNIFGLKIDEGPNNEGQFSPYIQSERIKIYQEYAYQLLTEEKAYRCFCSEERLEKLRLEAEQNKVAFLYDGHCSHLSETEIKEKLTKGEPYVIRQKVSSKGSTEYNDLVYGKIKIENKYLEDQILIKSDGYPTYNFANVIDDHLMKITHVTRGNEYLSSTPKYLLLYDAFGWESPLYIHMPHVVKLDGTKISKRNKDDNLIDLINDGYLPEAIINYLAFLGWSPTDNVEIMNMKELVEKFDYKRINKSAGTYDIMKLRWFNSHYIKELSDEKYLEFVLPYLDDKKYDGNWLKEVCLLYKNQISYGKEIISLTSLFFQDEIKLSKECQKFINNNASQKVIEIFKNKILLLKDWNLDKIKEIINEVKEESQESGKTLFMSIRIAVSGQMHGPDLVNTIYLLGQDKIKNNQGENYEGI